MNDRRIKKVLSLPIILSLILVLAKLIIFKVEGSLSILSLCVDSIFDFISSTVILFAYNYSIKEKNDDYKYGFYGIADIAILFTSVLILITIFLIYKNAVVNIINKKTLNYSNIAIIVMSISTIISLIIIVILKKNCKNNNILVIKGEIAHYSTDTLTNGGVLLSIIFCKFIYNHYIIDPIIAIIMASTVLKPAIEILIDAINNIMSKEIENSKKEIIINIISGNKDVISYSDLRTRRSGDRIFIQVKVQISKDKSFIDVHNVVRYIKKEIQSSLENSEIIIHACPA